MNNTACPLVGLHRHTTYSPLDGCGKIVEQVIPRLKELGQDTCAMTDHGSLFGHLDFYNAMRQAGLKPILGVEAYHVDDMRVKGDKEKGSRKQKGLARNEFAHLTLLARTNEGYSNLLKLTNASYSDGFYYVPRVDWPEVVKYQQGLVVLSGCIIGHLSQLIVKDRAEDALAWARWLKERIEHFYIEIIPCPSLESSYKACKGLWQIAEELRIPTVLTDDAHFPRPEDHTAQDVAYCIGQGRLMSDTTRYSIPDIHFYGSGEDLLERARTVLPHITTAKLREAAERSVQIAAGCNVELPRSKGPTYPVSPGKTPDIQLQEWVAEGRAYRRKLGLLPEEGTSEWEVYAERERYELDIVRHHQFQNYFLLVTDIVRWSQEQDIWMIARGSAGGSLLCWYLGITQIDPIRFKLPVERFIDYTRNDLPDIDLDCDPRGKDRILQYITDKYGKDHCAQIGAISRFGARQAIRDVAKAYEIPSEVVERILFLVPESDADEGLKAEHILERFFADSAEAQTILEQYPELRVAAQLEGQVRQSTVHAAGVLVDEEPLDRLVSVAVFPGKMPIAACEKEGAARQGLLKIDILSVNQLGAIKETLEALNLNLDWLYRLPLDDRETFKVLSEGKNMGVFQLQGTAAGKLMQRIQPDRFDDLVAITGLARPGPLQSGGAEDFVNRRHGRAPIPNYHPIIQSVVGDTLGIILYQEQVMGLAQKVGQFEMADVQKVRKLVASIKGAQAMDAYKPAYLAGAKAQGVAEEEALSLWQQCLKAGNYLFNRAHNTQYAIIAYWSAYLKTHYPALFTAIFAKWQEDSGQKRKKERLRAKLFQEFKERGGRFILLDYNRSKETFTVLDDKTILGGFTNLVGCGESIAADLVARQPYESWEHFYQECPKIVRERLQACGVHNGQIEPDMALVWAPWFRQISFCDFERAAFKKLECRPIASAMESSLRDVRIMGRVCDIELINTVAEAKKYGDTPPDPKGPIIRAVVSIADPTGCIEVHFNPRKLAQIMRERQDRNPFGGPHGGVANTIYVQGTLSEDRSRLYGADALCVREARPMPASETPRKRPKKADMEKLEEQLTMELVF